MIRRMMPSSRFGVAATLLTIVGLSPFASAQAPRRIDAGTLEITANTPMGTKVTTEDFTIVQNADGGFTMTSVTTGGRRMRTVLTTDALGFATAYDHHGRGGEAVEKTITSRRDENGALVLSEASTRNPPFPPLRLPAETMLFGDGGIALSWFLGFGAVPRDVAYFHSGRWATIRARLTEAVREPVTIGGRVVDATHLVLDDGTTQRHVWFDARKRLLKVTLGTNIIALRTSLPE